MKEQNQSPEGRFTIERFSLKGPFYLQTTQKVATLKNKITFYEGQLDPLHTENSHIKQSHMNIARLVSISTEILRNLLPVGNSPAKKLKLEMASIDEIAKMIQTDWKDMEQTIACLNVEKKEMGEEISDWKQRLRLEQERRIKEVEQLQNSMQQLKKFYEAKVQNLQSELSRKSSDLQRYKEQAANEQALRDKIIESCNRELELFRRQANCRYNDYERCIARLNSQMENNLVQFQQGKKMVKQICEKLMNDKLAELAEAYEIMLKTKEEEKFALQLNIDELTEENAKRLKEKNQEIQALVIQNDNKKAQIKTLEDQLYNKKEQLMRQIKDNKDLQTQLLRANEKIQSLLERVRKQETTIQQHVEKLKATIQEYQQGIKLLKDQGSEAMNQILTQKRRLQNQIIEKDNKLKDFKTALETVEETYKELMENAQKKWLQKQSQYTAEIAKNLKKIEQQKERSKRIKEQKDKQIQNLGKEHQFIVKRLQKQFEQNKQSYIREQTLKMQKILEQNEEQMVRLKLNYKKQLQAEMSKMHQSVRAKLIEMELKLAENEKRFEQERKRYEDQISIIKIQEKLLNQQLAKAKKQALEHEDLMQKLKIEQIKALRKLELENEMNVKKWEQMMESQMQQFLKELQLKDSKISSLQQQFNQEREQLTKLLSNKDSELSLMKENMQKQINSLKDNNGMMEMENKYKSQLADLQSTLKAKIAENQQKYNKKIKNIIEKHERQIKQLIEEFDKKFLNAHQSFQNILIILGSEFQKKSTFFNDKFLADEITEKLKGMNQEEKIEFIRLKMEETVNSLIEKDNQIAYMQNQLERFQKKFEEEMSARRKELDIEKMNLIQSCNNKIAEKQEECRLKIQAIQNERRAFSEELFQQFCEMKTRHAEQFRNLEKKYRQLQELFSIRPSRAEDVTKIKELISIQTKLDQDIIIYHKKMETANEIVKYLNLQLENYKETYDIFGPHDHAYNSKTISFMDQSHKLMDYYKQKELEKAKEERHCIQLDKRNTESPDIKELRIFTQKEEEHSQSIIIEPKQPGRSRKYSLVPEKVLHTRDRFKTQKLTDRESELMGHAETFMKLIKKTTTQDVSVIKELEGGEDSKKKTYRRRKLKRLATGVVEHYF